ncbi:MAG TPA: cupin domain-containing protein [Actinomycetota bacterium]|nr:cupin domain-containing protein [Actinomycetota bacterium]
MAVRRADDHPQFELGGNTITSLASPAIGADESVLFRIEVPPGGGLPKHRHDHLDVFTVERGSGTIRIDDEPTMVSMGDVVVVPTGAWHVFVAGDNGASIVATMLAGTKLIREDGSESVPPWVS